jgi:hypothetical protein
LTTALITLASIPLAGRFAPQARAATNTPVGLGIEIPYDGPGDLVEMGVKADEMIKRINDFREAHGKRRLVKVQGSQMADCCRKKVRGNALTCDKTCHDGGNCGTIGDQGLGAEICGYASSVDALFEAYKDSPEHRSVLLLDGFREIASACAKGCSRLHKVTAFRN